jgi:hypothetical protein
VFWTSFAAVAKADQRLKPPVALQDCIESDPELRDKLLRIVNRSSAGTAQINDLAQAIFADPFRVSGFGRETTASEALVKFMQNGYEPTDNWMDDLYKQRKRFLELGFFNTKYAHAEVTKPYQHFGCRID